MSNPNNTHDDDFCGAAGDLFENSRIPLPGEPAQPQEIYAFESRVVDRLHAFLNATGQEQASVIFDEPQALTEGFKQVLLEVLHRKKKEAHRNQRILTVSHSEMGRVEQVPFLRERSEVPMVTVRSATHEELEMMYSLRTNYPELMDALNAIKSNRAKASSIDIF